MDQEIKELLEKINGHLEESNKLLVGLHKVFVTDQHMQALISVVREGNATASVSKDTLAEILKKLK